jgi:arylsulfatase A-like enzyme
MIHLRIAALFASVFLCSQAAAAPNFVVIMTDDQEAESLAGMNGAGSGLTYSWLVRRGVTFRNSFVVTPQCGPSRASFLKGQYPHNHGLWSNNVSPFGYAQFSEQQTLAVWLRNAGYATSLIGKYINGYGTVAKTLGNNPQLEVPPGWSNWQAFVGSPDYYNYTLNVNGSLEPHQATDADYSTDVIARKAASFIASQGSSPFFLWVTFNAPHDPFTAPSRYAKSYGSLAAPRSPGWNEADVTDKPAYVRGLPLLGTAGTSWINQTYRSQMGALAAVDDGVGTIMNQLAASGLLSNTYVIFTSDNGYMRGEHRLPYNKVVPYEPSIRVPLVISGPGIPPETERGDLVTNIDLTATIVDLAGARAGLALDGKSLRPLWSTSQYGPPFRNYLLFEFMTNFPQNYPVPAGQPYTVPAYAAIRSFGYKFTQYNTGEIELYDMTNDPSELRSAHADQTAAPVLATYMQALQSMRSCVGSTCVK